MNRIFIPFLLGILFFTSCKLISPSVMFETEKDFNFTPFTDTQKVTILQPYDQLQILMVPNNGTTLLESAISGSTQNNIEKNSISYMVRKDSTIKLPTLGVIKVGGLSKDSAEVILEKEFSNYYQSPFVRIQIINRNVMIFLDEAQDGHVVQVPEDGITLIEAIAGIGGLSETSKSFKIKLIRGNNKNPEVYNYNIRSLEEFKKANFILETNDIIYIESKPRYAFKVLQEIQPYLMLISTAVLTYSLFVK